MSKTTKQKQKSEEPVEQTQPEAQLFTGIARSVECYNTHGKYKNFKILTMEIKDGVVVSIKRSDPYANWEAISRLELLNLDSVLHLNSNWKSGKALSK